MDVTAAIQFGQLVGETYDVLPSDLTNSAGKVLTAGGTQYTVERFSTSPAVHRVAADPLCWVQFVAVATKGVIEGLQESCNFGFVQSDDGMQHLREET
jgi:hypothetical protein